MILWIILVCLCSPLPSQGSGIEFIIDNSRAMMSPLEGRPRLEKLKEILVEALSTVPEEWQVSLRVFGGGAKCGPHSRMTVPASAPRASLIASIDQMEALGVASVVSSLAKVKEDLSRVRGGKVGILIGAGQNDCDGPKSMDRIGSALQGVKIHAILIGASELTRWQGLARVVETTGGQLTLVRNLKDLEDSLNTILYQETANVHILMFPPPGRELEGGTIQILNSRGETELSFLFEGNEAFAHLKPGNYILSVIAEGALKGEKRFSLKRDERVEMKIELRPELSGWLTPTPALSYESP